MIKTKIALISDVHGNLPALKAVLDDMKNEEDVSSILCAGDIVGYNPFPNEVADIIRREKIDSVLGNHDKAFITGDTSWFNQNASRAVHWSRNNASRDTIDLILELPKEISKKLDEKNEDLETSITITHGSPSSINEYVFPGTISLKLKGMLDEVGSDILVLGHTHIPMVKNFGNGVIINPGSVGQPRDGDERSSYCILYVEKTENLEENISERWEVINQEKKDENNQTEISMQKLAKNPKYKISMHINIKRIEYNIEEVMSKISSVDLPQNLGGRLKYGK